MKVNKAIKAIISIVLVIALAMGGFLTYRHFKVKNNMPEMGRENRLTEKVNRTSFTTTITASGSVQLDDEIEVYAEGETNIIKTILVEEGDTVKSSDLLVEYDVEDKQEELENNIRDTKREIENANLSLESMTAKATDTEITKLKSAITAKEKSLQDAKTSYDSYSTKIIQQKNTFENAEQDVIDAEKELSDIKALMGVGGATQSEYDTAVTNLDKVNKTLAEAKQSYNDLLTEQNNAKLSITTAENDIVDAENAYNDALTPLNSESEKIQYEQQKLALQGLQDKLADYQQDLSELVYTTSSTVNGKVTEVCVDEGTYTEENTVILKVADFSKLIVNASIEEYDAPLVAVGQSVIMTSDGLEGKEYTGTVTRVNDSAEDTSTVMGTESTVPIEISVDNPDGILKPGYNLDLEITVVDKQDVLAITSGAIQTDGKTNTKYVYAVDCGTVIKKDVTTGEVGDTVTEILTGLNEGDEIIISVNDGIIEGMTLDEVRALNESANTVKTSEEKSDEEMGSMMMGGMANDQNRGANQGVPSRGAGGGGFGGGRPMG